MLKVTLVWAPKQALLLNLEQAVGFLRLSVLHAF